MSYLERVQQCHDYEQSDYLEFVIAGEVMGLMLPTFAHHLLRWPEVFQLEKNQLILNPTLNSFDQRTQAVAPIVQQLYEERVIPSWVGEPYAVSHHFEGQAKMSIERAAASYFGVRSYGIHINGLVQTSNGVYNWVAVRARDKPFWPGKYDQMVAGGQGIGIGLMENVIKESAEEADISADIACKAQQRTTLSYCSASHRGLNINTLFTYDLWLPEDFTPVNTDGEVDEFILMPLEQVAETIDTTDQFKINCNLVNIDLLIRSGVISASHPDFKAITDLLYAPVIELN
jgi:hypothetical protein